MKTPQLTNKSLRKLRIQLMEEIFKILMKEGPSKISQHRRYIKLIINPKGKIKLPDSASEKLRKLVTKVMSSNSKGELQELFESKTLPELMESALVCPMWSHTPQSARKLYVYSVIADVVPYLVTECTMEGTCLCCAVLCCATL